MDSHHPGGRWRAGLRQSHPRSGRADTDPGRLSARRPSAWDRCRLCGDGGRGRRVAAAIRNVRDKKVNKAGMDQEQPASELISERIAELGDWRGATLGRMRKLIRQADPDVVEEWKWRGTPVWSHDGIICTGESYKTVVKLTFAKGASLKDPARLFNSSLDGNVRRAIDIKEGEKVDESEFKVLIRQAVSLNNSGKSKSPKKAKS